MWGGRSIAAASVVALSLLCLPTATSAQPPVGGLSFDGVKTETARRQGLVVAVDADDNDEDGVVDARQASDVPLGSVRAFDVHESAVPGRLRVEGGVRLIRDGQAVSAPVALRARDGRAEWGLQGVHASTEPEDAALVLEPRGGRTVRVPVTVAAVGMLDANNALLDARHDALGISRRITNDASLPRQAEWDSRSPGPENVRIEVHDPIGNADATPTASLRSIDPGSGRVQWRLEGIPLSRPGVDRPFRSPWIRLVADEIDARAPGVGGQVLRVGLRDIVQVRYETEGYSLTQALRVGRPGDEDGPRAARRAELRVRLLRLRPGGRPVIGADDEAARRIAREQVAIANEIWSQCFISFGDPAEADIAIVDPPRPSLISVANGSGLPARGGGAIRFRAADRTIGPLSTRAQATPVDVALDIAGALRNAGLKATVTENTPTEFGAGRSADVLVRDARGGDVTLQPVDDSVLSTDPRQSVDIGEVDLGDGVQEFDNMNATAGTLEERTLLKNLTDEDPSTIDLVLVNHFTAATRQGEAFIESDGGAIVNTVLLDRKGLQQQRAAWTQAHETGHVLLDQPYHPDNFGPDRPWLLMDADTALPLVTGPKRLTPEQCQRMRSVSGVDAVPALLHRMDARADPPAPRTEPFDRGYPR